MPSAPKWLFDTVEHFIPKLPLVEVTHTQLLSRSVKKIRFKGDFKNAHFSVGAYIDFRVSDTEARRYTVSNADTQNGFMELIVHLHGNGPGCRFMNNLTAGSRINMNKPRGERNYYDKSAENFIIFGDETSLALACSFLPVLKKNKHQFQFYFELDNENKNVPELLGIENCLIFPKNGSFRNEEWISDLPVFRTVDHHKTNFILTGNGRSAQTFKKVIKIKGIQKIYLHGYWLEGKKGL
jgi:NADPH-dependent ferric siderophore reductase